MKICLEKKKVPEELTGDIFLWKPEQSIKITEMGVLVIIFNIILK